MLPIEPTIHVPLRHDPDGTIRIGETSILLDVVIYAFRRGESPEQIKLAYPNLKLADIFAVISYYMYHQAEVDEYIRQGELKSDQNQQEIEAGYSPETQEFLARLRQKIS